MKISRITLLIVIMLVAGSYAFSQGYRRDRTDRPQRSSRNGGGGGDGGGLGSTNGVPAPGNYEGFSAFIARRNIFDPNRQPSFSGSTAPRPQTIRRGAPFFMLVGTMSYSKGAFAFFDGNNSDSRQALQVAGKIQDYTVTAITTKGVTIESTDKKTQDLLIGDRMQEENGKWLFLNGNAMNDSGAPASDEGAGSSGESASAGSTSQPQTPPSGGESNDILKRLMQLREKENQ